MNEWVQSSEVPIDQSQKESPKPYSKYRRANQGTGIAWYSAPHWKKNNLAKLMSQDIWQQSLFFCQPGQLPTGTRSSYVGSWLAQPSMQPPYLEILIQCATNESHTQGHLCRSLSGQNYKATENLTNAAPGRLSHPKNLLICASRHVIWALTTTGST